MNIRKTQDPYRHRLAFLEGLRGIAAVVVMIHHLSLAFWPTVYFGTPSTSHHPIDLLIYNWSGLVGFMHAGTFSVFVFFVLSGYVMTFRYNDTSDLYRLQSSSIKRFLRLGIPAGGSVLLALILLKLGLMYNHTVADYSRSPWLNWFYNSPARFSTGITDALYGVLLLGKSDYNSSLWTLSTEFYGSIMVMGMAVIFAPLRRIGLLVAPLFGIALAINFGAASLGYFAIIAGWCLTGLNRHNKWPWYICLFLLISALFAAGANNSPAFTWLNLVAMEFGQFKIDTTQIVYALAAISLLTAILKSETLETFFGNRIFVYLGKISFSLYVLQFPIICSVGCFALTVFIKHFTYNLAAMFAAAITIASCFLVSHLYELTFDRFSIRVSQSFFEFICPSRQTRSA